MSIIQAPKNHALVRVLHISQLFKEHITDAIVEVNRKAAEKRFSENSFDLFGFVDHRDTAFLRFEARSTQGVDAIVQGAYAATYREVVPRLLQAFDAGHLCLAHRTEVELLVNAPCEAPQYQRFLKALEGWKQSNMENS